MPRFFVTSAQVQGDEIVIQGNDVNHIKNVLRMRPGDELSLSDGEGMDYSCKIASIERDEVRVSIEEAKASCVELPVKLYLFQGLPKADKMELIIQKAVELGVYEIIPVRTKRVIVKLDDKKESKKIARWQQIAEGGAKQSGRTVVPKVQNVMSYKEALQYAKKLDVLMIPYELADGMDVTKQVVEGLAPGQSVGIFIGPEGGFEVSEVDLAIEYGAKPVSLGKRILRTETAGLTTLSILMYQLECKNHNL